MSKYIAASEDFKIANDMFYLNTYHRALGVGTE